MDELTFYIFHLLLSLLVFSFIHCRSAPNSIPTSINRLFSLCLRNCDKKPENKEENFSLMALRIQSMGKRENLLHTTWIQPKTSVSFLIWMNSLIFWSENLFFHFSFMQMLEKSFMKNFKKKKNFLVVWGKIKTNFDNNFFKFKFKI